MRRRNKKKKKTEHRMHACGVHQRKKGVVMSVTQERKERHSEAAHPQATQSHAGGKPFFVKKR